ncbi:sensor histidine kinase [Microvirga sp. TS319]|uniref:sensor histidine kinase n=1 Tax=Microvirga sp. TS319 TaxID=3241165 RepID=UPI00351A2479
MTRNSIRLRLLIVAITSIVVTIAVAGASLVMFFERQVLRYVEQDLNIHWTELATAFGAEGETDLSQRLTDPRYHQPYGGAYWQVSEGGRPILRSRSLWDRTLPADEPRQGADRDKAFEVEGPDGSELYVIAREVTIGGEQGSRTFSLAVALDHAQVVELRQAFGWDVTRVLLPIAAVLVLFAWLQVSLGLRPLRSVGRDLNAVQTGHIRRMTRRFPDEVAPLVESINKLLDRQENLVRKARDRAGALAHGLKTPLTILGGEVRRLEQAGKPDAAERMHEQLELIRSHVEREVARARTSGASVACGAYTQVDETVARLLRLMQHLPRGEQLVWQTRIPTELAVDMDPHDLGEVMGNLLDNARKWASTRVDVRAEPTGDNARITVEDDGPGFPGADGARPERGMTGRCDSNSSGLGLGIVEDILAEYGTSPNIDGSGRCSISFEIPLCRERLVVTSRKAIPREGQASSPWSSEITRA